jgi:hypothetical protein
MGELLTGLTQQHEFPRVDLTDDNADLLELMMANTGIVDTSHQTIEDMSWIFRVGHVSLMKGAAEIYPASERLAAINRGVTTFEAITGIVGGIAMMSDPTPVNRQFSKLRAFGSNEIGDYYDSALQSFTTETPRAAEVVRISSARFHGPLTSYAVLGAAISRQFELDCVA